MVSKSARDSIAAIQLLKRIMEFPFLFLFIEREQGRNCFKKRKPFFPVSIGIKVQKGLFFCRSIMLKKIPLKRVAVRMGRRLYMRKGVYLFCYSLASRGPYPGRV